MLSQHKNHRPVTNVIEAGVSGAAAIARSSSLKHARLERTDGRQQTTLNHPRTLDGKTLACALVVLSMSATLLWGAYDGFSATPTSTRWAVKFAVGVMNGSVGERRDRRQQSLLSNRAQANTVESSVDSSVDSTLAVLRHLATKSAAVPGGDVYVAGLLPVLTPDGVQLLVRAFLEPFRIVVETSCLHAQGGGDASGQTSYNASWYRSMCNTDPKQLPKGACGREGIGAPAWCTKFAAEWAIPSIIEGSPWAATTDGPVDAMVVHTNGLCEGPYSIGVECAKRFDKNPPKRWPGHKRTFHFLMHDHGPCSILGVPEFGFDAQTWASPIVSVNGERWSSSASQPCHTPHRDIVVPTPNMMVPSFEGSALLSVAATASTLPQRTTLAAMVMGSAFVHRAMMERLYDKDKDVIVHYRLDHAEYIKMLLSSKFCLQLDGQAPWSPRLVEYMAAGCVPVIVSDALLPPFQRLLNWSTFSVRVPLRRAAELKTILRGLVASGEYATLHRHVLSAAEAFKYYLDDGTRGAIPLVVAEMIAVVESPPPPKPPHSAPYEWQRPYCLFLEDCSTGCDNDNYPPNQGRDSTLANYTPCDPVLFMGCTRVSKNESALRRSQNSSLFELPVAWGEPTGSPNVTLCSRALDYEAR
jgi:hypothetical protein